MAVKLQQHFLNAKLQLGASIRSHAPCTEEAKKICAKHVKEGTHQELFADCVFDDFHGGRRSQCANGSLRDERLVVIVSLQSALAGSSRCPPFHLLHETA